MSKSDPADEFPPISFAEARAAAVRRRGEFAYRFPRDPRPLGGKFPVEENARRLLRFFYLERRLSHALGSWTLGIPEFEVKVETGRHIFYHMDAAHALRQRLNEQELRLSAIDDYRDPQLDLFVDELLCAADAPELLVGVHQVAGKALELAYRHHCDDTAAVADAPTLRVLRRILLDYEPMREWADAAIAAYLDGGVDESRLSRWRWHLQQLLGSIGGISGSEARTAEPAPLRHRQQPYVRGQEPKRDSRFTTFCHTGDYEVGDGQARFPKDSYEGARLRFIRTQRDEVDAIEAFGTFLWDIRFKDFTAEHHLARITWDEARHTELGHKALLDAGYDPFELPNRLTGSICRGPMDPAYAMAEINLFGEVGVLKTINQLIEQARGRKDMVVEHLADFVRADERTHVRKGQHVIRVMTDLKMQDLELRTRELFTECLVNLGAIRKDMDVFTVSREDLEELVGE
ncbi:MAG: hypothetical protein FJY95_21810 [Candidatus Handelsmanbacteria bacterium]|nr:hypothetical protein [Candidatus Handelsmanbacteria bacterium]